MMCQWELTFGIGSQLSHLTQQVTKLTNLRKAKLYKLTRLYRSRMISIEIVVQLGIVFTEWGGISGGTNTVIYIKFKTAIFLC